MAHVPAWAWIGFGVTVVVLLTIDLVAHGGKGGFSHRSAIRWSLFWIAAALAFGGAVWAILGSKAAHAYYAAYAMEKSLSLDNLFLFLIVFSTLGIPREQHRRALFFGIAGAFVLRALFIWLGVEVLSRLSWMNWLFGGFLVFAAVQAARETPSENDESKVAKWLSRHLPVTDKLHGPKLFAREDGRRLMTPILVSILTIEVADIAFAVDSVPAALSITTDPFLVYSSNAFAILGLRSLYAVLVTTIAAFRYLHLGIAAVLAFAAVKIVGTRWFHIPPLLSVGIIVVLIGIAVVASLLERRESRSRVRA